MQIRALVFFGVLTCLAVVSQLDLLEDQRKKILSQCAFSIQCCWLRFQRRRRRARQQSAVLIQAGKLLMPWPGTTDWNQQSSVASLPRSLLPLTPLSGQQEPAGGVCTQRLQADRSCHNSSSD